MTEVKDGDISVGSLSDTETTYTPFLDKHALDSFHRSEFQVKSNHADIS